DFAAADGGANGYRPNRIAVHDMSDNDEDCTHTRDLRRQSYCAETCHILTSLLSLAVVFFHLV
ncbi:hypothetical protein PENTCL1PPCAC_645, partial [Pristionchus entomophagus]